MNFEQEKIDDKFDKWSNFGVFYILNPTVCDLCCDDAKYFISV